MTNPQYDGPEDRGQYDAGHDDELAKWEEAAARTRAMRQERLAGGWNPDGKNTGRRTLTGAEALAQLAEQRDTAPTPQMRKIQAEIEARNWLDSQRIGDDVDDSPQRLLDWLGNHSTGNVGPS